MSRNLFSTLALALIAAGVACQINGLNNVNLLGSNVNQNYAQSNANGGVAGTGVGSSNGLNLLNNVNVAGNNVSQNYAQSNSNAAGQNGSGNNAALSAANAGNQIIAQPLSTTYAYPVSASYQPLTAQWGNWGNWNQLGNNLQQAIPVATQYQPLTAAPVVVAQPVNNGISQATANASAIANSANQGFVNNVPVQQIAPVATQWQPLTAAPVIVAQPVNNGISQATANATATANSANQGLVNNVPIQQIAPVATQWQPLTAAPVIVAQPVNTNSQANASASANANAGSLNQGNTFAVPVNTVPVTIAAPVANNTSNWCPLNNGAINNNALGGLLTSLLGSNGLVANLLSPLGLDSLVTSLNLDSTLNTVLQQLLSNLNITPATAQGNNCTYLVNAVNQQYVDPNQLYNTFNQCIQQANCNVPVCNGVYQAYAQATATANAVSNGNGLSNAQANSTANAGSN